MADARFGCRGVRAPGTRGAPSRTRGDPARPWCGRAGVKGPVPVLHEIDGRPCFVCPPGSPLGAAPTTGSAAILQVGDGQVTVVLAGSLAHVDVEWVDGARVEVFELKLASIVVEDGGADATAVTMVEIPIEAWLGQDTMHVCSERTLAHTNSAHGLELRQFVARREGLPEAQVASAELAELDCTGVSVAWVDIRGAHHQRITFTNPARTPGQLGHALRAQLRS